MTVQFTPSSAGLTQARTQFAAAQRPATTPVFAGLQNDKVEVRFGARKSTPVQRWGLSVAGAALAASSIVGITGCGPTTDDGSTGNKPGAQATAPVKVGDASKAPSKNAACETKTPAYTGAKYTPAGKVAVNQLISSGHLDKNVPQSVKDAVADLPKELVAFWSQTRAFDESSPALKIGYQADAGVLDKRFNHGVYALVENSGGGVIVTEKALSNPATLRYGLAEAMVAVMQGQSQNMSTITEAPLIAGQMLGKMILGKPELASAAKKAGLAQDVIDASCGQGAYASTHEMAVSGGTPGVEKAVEAFLKANYGQPGDDGFGGKDWKTNQLGLSADARAALNKALS